MFPSIAHLTHEAWSILYGFWINWKNPDGVISWKIKCRDTVGFVSGRIYDYKCYAYKKRVVYINLSLVCDLTHDCILRNTTEGLLLNLYYGEYEFTMVKYYGPSDVVIRLLPLQQILLQA